MIRQKRMLRLVIAFLAAAILTVNSGCQFGTKIVLETDSPDKVLQHFFEELQAGNYEACDQYLADNATFVFQDDTDYYFAGTLMDEMTKHVSYVSLEEPVIDSLNASQKIRVSSIDYEALVKWMSENIDKMEDKYLQTTGRFSMDSQNHYDVSRVLAIAIEEYAKNAATVRNQITVHYVFSEEQWKIKVDAALITAIFGGVVND